MTTETVGICKREGHVRPVEEIGQNCGAGFHNFPDEPNPVVEGTMEETEEGLTLYSEYVRHTGHPLEALETCYDNSVEYTRWVQCTRCNEGFRMEMVVL